MAGHQHLYTLDSGSTPWKSRTIEEGGGGAEFYRREEEEHSGRDRVIGYSHNTTRTLTHTRPSHITPSSSFATSVSAQEGEQHREGQQSQTAYYNSQPHPHTIQLSHPPIPSSLSRSNTNTKGVHFGNSFDIEPEHVSSLNGNCNTLTPPYNEVQQHRSTTTTRTTTGRFNNSSNTTPANAVKEDSSNNTANKDDDDDPSEYETVVIVSRNKVFTKVVHKPRGSNKTASSKEDSKKNKKKEKTSLLSKKKSKGKETAFPVHHTNSSAPEIYAPVEVEPDDHEVKDDVKIKEMASIYASGHYQQQQQNSNSNNNTGNNNLTSRDYGYSNHHHHHVTETGGIMKSSGPSTTGGNGSTSNSVGPSSGKLSQMLGLSHADRDVAFFSSSSSQSRHPHHHHHQHPHGNNGSMPPPPSSPSSSSSISGFNTQPQSHTRLTLKKARSLFSSSGRNGSGNNNKDREKLEPGIPSPPILKPKGMGSYGEAFVSSSSPPVSGLPTSSSSMPSGLSGLLPSSSSSSRFGGGGGNLVHSKSHGSLSGGRNYHNHHHQTSPTSFGFDNPPPLPGQSLSHSAHTSPHHHSPHHHPYAASSSHKQGPLDGSNGRRTARQEEEDTTCPVCLESLAIRLNGEKAHVVPLCGHKLHNDCFETAYGITVQDAIEASESSRGEGAMLRRKKHQALGICGICRSEMKIGDPSESAKNKFAMLSGQPGRAIGVPALDTHKIHSISNRTIHTSEEDSITALPTSASLHDPNEDQDILNPHELLPAYMQHLALGPSRSSPFTDKIIPKVNVRAEHTSLTRPNDPEKRVHLTCLVTVEIPSRVPPSLLYQRNEHESEHHQQGGTGGMTASNSNRSLGHIAGQHSQSTISGVYPNSNDGGRSLSHAHAHAHGMGMGHGHDMASHHAASSISGRDRSVSNPGTVISSTGGAGAPPSIPLPTTRAQATAAAHHLPPLRRESSATAHTHGTEDFPTSPSMSTFSNAISQGNAENNRAPNNNSNAATSHGMEKTLSGMTSISSSGGAGSSSRHNALTPATTVSSAFTPNSTSASSFEETGAGAQYARRNDINEEEDNSHHHHYYNSGMNSSAVTLTAAAQEEKTREAHGPFADIFKDLQDRMVDWKGHQPSNFGSLRMYDSLAVKKDKNVREFVVYLFEEALLCVVDDRRKGNSSSTATTAISDHQDQEKLRLKGRVFVKHMRQVEDTSSVNSGLSLTIHMEDDSLENFVILFPHRETLEVWRSQIQALIDHHRPPIPSSNPKTALSTSAGTGSRRDSVFSNETSRSAHSSISRVTKMTSATSVSGSGPVPEGAIPPVPMLKKSMQSLNNRLLSWTPPDPATFVPLDLMLVLSVQKSGVSGGPSGNALKVSVIRDTLKTIIHSIGPRARISIVAYSTGDASQAYLRKTPWLATGREDGMKRLEQAISELAGESVNRNEEGLTLVDPKEEKVTVATAMNLALDIVLQRQSKSTTCGLILLNDGKDGAPKQQIDLVLARADAASVPIHSFGWGKSHDPSSLWLLSNHTKGTYTFVPDFYLLRDAIAGCIGAMLCVAVHGLRLHLSVQEKRWFKIRKVAGVATAIVSSDGKDVDINLGELRFGEKKEMLVEVEMASPKKGIATATSSSHNESGSRTNQLSRKKSMTATDDFFLQKVGVNPLSLGDDLATTDFFDEVEEGMADDVPVFDVNASFKNPQDPAGETCKLPYPSLLTITVLPPSKAANGADSPSSSPSMISNTVSDPTIVRRRMELLTSDMITRTLLLMSRRQDAHAQRLLTETTRIFSAIMANLVPSSTHESGISPDTRYASEVLQACLEDVEQLKAGCGDRQRFDTNTRNFGAQQAVALRDQRAWTDRTATEELFFCREWTAIFGRAFTT